MFIGHFAAALGSKRVAPEVPLGVAMAAAFGIDLIWPLLLLAGVEQVRVEPGNTAFTHLAFESYPWSHSLLMVAAWAVVGGTAAGAWLRSRVAGIAVGLLVVSHWLLDWLTHRPDLPLWPGGPVTGLGLWNSIPGTFLVEGTLFGGCLYLYVVASKPEGRIGSLGLKSLVALSVLIWATQPWAPPPPDANAVAWGALALWLLPVWGQWVDRHRSPFPEVA